MLQSHSDELIFLINTFHIKRSEGRQTVEPEKAHSTGEFIIVAKFGDHVLRRLASSLLNVIRQAGR